jgi:hypothetical protein
MNSFRVLGAATALALLVPLAVPTASFAQSRAQVVAGGGGGMRMGGGGGGGAAFRGGGGNFAAAARPAGIAPSFSGGGRFAATAPSGGGRSFAAAAPSGHWGGNWHGGWHRRGFWPGVAAGATIGALGSSYAYYGGPYYDDPFITATPTMTTARPSQSSPMAAATRRPTARSASSHTIRRRAPISVMTACGIPVPEMHAMT